MHIVKMFFNTLFKKLINKDLFSIMRIGLGLIAILLVMTQLQDPHFYSNLDLISFHSSYNQISTYSFNLLKLSDSNEWFYFLNFLQILLALFLILDVRARIMSFLLWIIVVSFQNSNPAILYGGDVAYRLFLLSYIFLPKNQKDWGSSIPLKFKLFCIYFFAAIFKAQELVWREGLAINEYFKIQHLAGDLARELLNFPTFLKFLNYSTLAMEFIGPFFILFAYKKVSKKVLIGFISLHLGISIFLSVGHFTLIMLVPLLSLYFQDQKYVPQNNNILSTMTIFVFCSLVLALNLNTVFETISFHRALDFSRPITHILRLDQKWAMFDNPYDQPDGDFFVLNKGGKYYLDGTSYGSKSILNSYPNHRWVKLLMTLYKESQHINFDDRWFRKWICKVYRFKGEYQRLYFHSIKDNKKSLLLRFNCK